MRKVTVSAVPPGKVLHAGKLFLAVITQGTKIYIHKFLQEKKVKSGNFEDSV